MLYLSAKFLIIPSMVSTKPTMQIFTRRVYAILFALFVTATSAEASYAKLMGKFVIGLRTDVRSPYGTPIDNFGGMHFFPAYQTNQFIPHYMPSKTPKERNDQMSSLVQIIDTTIKNTGISHANTIPEYAKINPNFQKVFEGAHLLFFGIKDIHSEEGLEEIVLRFINNKEKIEELASKIF